jgi:hypothetical protein
MVDRYSPRSPIEVKERNVPSVPALPSQSERNAYGVENEWLRLGNMPMRNIGDILAHPPYSDNPDINRPLFSGLDGPQ